MGFEDLISTFKEDDCGCGKREEKVEKEFLGKSIKECAYFRVCRKRFEKNECEKKEDKDCDCKKDRDQDRDRDRDCDCRKDRCRCCCRCCCR